MSGSKHGCGFFFYFYFESDYDVLKSNSPCFLLNKNIKFKKNETKSKMENFSSSKNCQLKVKLWWVGARKKRVPICRKGIFSVKNRKSDHYYRTQQHIPISLVGKLYLKQTILIFLIKFAQKWYFRPKTEKVNITIKFNIFKLVQQPYFILNILFLFFLARFAQKK